ncbi:hypothetical protein CEXT_676171 [Caerostris extrusa]|uniref:Uncharacterized protein n=1 Tax=Caerostris extrusa TaxID=172846 RepID=A0AAV4WRX5_CAEEX|nr:hypothetical protein CEXT_676171 [Caerostris extrusa]
MLRLNAIPIVFYPTQSGYRGWRDGRKVDDKKKRDIPCTHSLPPTLKTPALLPNRIPKAVIFRISVAFWEVGRIEEGVEGLEEGRRQWGLDKVLVLQKGAEAPAKVRRKPAGRPGA